MSICVLAERYGVKGQTLRKQYKEKISDYRNWDQLEHAHDYLLYPENIGENLSLDETCLSNGDVYTILTNKAAKGRKGALVAMVRGVATDAVSGILRRLPHRKRLSVKTVTTDLSSAMMLTVRKVFPAAKLINDRFGHEVGDQFLIQVGQRLRHVCSENDILGRLGGDEFLVAGLSQKSEEDQHTRMQRVKDQLQQQLCGDYQLGAISLFYPGASLGVIEVDPRETA